MKFQILFSGENKKNISLCRPLKIIHRGLSVKMKNIILSVFGILTQFDFYSNENCTGQWRHVLTIDELIVACTKWIVTKTTGRKMKKKKKKKTS